MYEISLKYSFADKHKNVFEGVCTIDYLLLNRTFDTKIFEADLRRMSTSNLVFSVRMPKIKMRC